MRKLSPVNFLSVLNAKKVYALNKNSCISSTTKETTKERKRETLKNEGKYLPPFKKHIQISRDEQKKHCSQRMPNLN